MNGPSFQSAVIHLSFLVPQALIAAGVHEAFGSADVDGIPDVMWDRFQDC